MLGFWWQSSWMGATKSPTVALRMDSRSLACSARSAVTDSDSLLGVRAPAGMDEFPSQ